MQLSVTYGSLVDSVVRANTSRSSMLWILEKRKKAREESCLVSTTTEVLYRVCVRVTLHHQNHSLDTYALLDDSSERTMLLPMAAQKLGLKGALETLDLRTIRQDIQTLNGASVSFYISLASNSKNRFAK